MNKIHIGAGIFVIFIISWSLSNSVLRAVVDFLPQNAHAVSFSPFETVGMWLYISIIITVLVSLLGLAVYRRALNIALPVLITFSIGAIFAWKIAVPVLLHLLVPNSIAQYYSIRKFTFFVIDIILFSGLLASMPVGIYQIKSRISGHSEHVITTFKKHRKKVYAIYAALCLIVSADIFIAFLLFISFIAPVEIILQVSNLSTPRTERKIYEEKKGESPAKDILQTHQAGSPLAKAALIIGGAIFLLSIYLISTQFAQSLLKAGVPHNSRVIYAVKSPTEFFFAKLLITANIMLIIFLPPISLLITKIGIKTSFLKHSYLEEIKQYLPIAGLTFSIGAGIAFLVSWRIIGFFCEYSLKTVNLIILGPLNIAEYLTFFSIIGGTSLTVVTLLSVKYYKKLNRFHIH